MSGREKMRIGSAGTSTDGSQVVRRWKDDEGRWRDAECGTDGLIWRQSAAAWLCHLPVCARHRGSELAGPVKPAVRGLCRHLLSMAGVMACVPFPESPAMCRVLVREGRIVPADGAIMAEGAPNECHWNAAALCALLAGLRHMTGYALSDDGMWRSHSWAVAPDGRVIETTHKMQRYFGVEVRTGKEERRRIRRRGKAV